MIPGGFEECHEKALQYGFQLVNHENTTGMSSSCYHCNVKNSNNKDNKQLYNQEFNLVGFTDIISGFKHWYDVANTKLKSFVKGPIKMLGNNTSTHHNGSSSVIGQ
jgi:hypothetical protein